MKQRKGTKMSKSFKQEVRDAVEFASKNIRKPKNQPEYTMCDPIEKAIQSQLPEGSKVMVMTGEPRGFDIVVWNPNGRICNSDHRSGYWVIKFLVSAELAELMRKEITALPLHNKEKGN